jgi:hypothetical protein
MNMQNVWMGLGVLCLGLTGCDREPKKAPNAESGNQVTLDEGPGLNLIDGFDAFAIEDDRLRAVVLEAADGNADGVIDLAEASELRVLDLSRKGLRTLEGIEIFKNLEVVTCTANALIDPTPLLQLPKLKAVSCTENSFSFEDCPVLVALRDRLGSQAQFEPQYGGLNVDCTAGELKTFLPLDPFEPPLDMWGQQITKDWANDIWGFVQDGQQYAVMGTYKYLYVYAVDNEIPSAKVVAKIDRKPENYSTWSEIRYKDGFLYQSTEGNKRVINEGMPNQFVQVEGDLLVIDFRDPSRPVVLDVQTPVGTAHNIALYKNYLLAFGGSRNLENGTVNQKGTRFFDITDPARPVYVATVGVYYVHDGMVQNDRLHVAQGDFAHSNRSVPVSLSEANRFAIFDVADLQPFKESSALVRYEEQKAEAQAAGRELTREEVLYMGKPQPVIDQIYPFGFCHNIWPSEDGNYLVVTGEQAFENQLSFWDISEVNASLANPQSAPEGAPHGLNRPQPVFVSGFNVDRGSFAHNAFIRGDRAYVSHYSKGVQVIDLSDRSKPRIMYSYDTFPSETGPTFDGSWGVFPFGERADVFWASDIATGFYLFKLNR